MTDEVDGPYHVARERERAETNKHLTIYFEEIVKKSFNRICASTIAGRKKPQTVSNVR